MVADMTSLLLLDHGYSRQLQPGSRSCGRIDGGREVGVLRPLTQLCTHKIPATSRKDASVSTILMTKAGYCTFHDPWEF